MSPASLAGPGTIVGGYLLGAPIGRGGGGRVFAASGPRDPPGAAPRLALKVVGLPVAADLRREAALQRRAAGPGVVPVLDVVEAGCCAALVTPLLPDGDLTALLRRVAPLPWPLAAVLVGRIADAVAAVHAAGVVHGDLTPGNVLVRRHPSGPQALLADFGCARPTPPGHAPPPGAGPLPGTRHWQAPEVRAQGVLTPAADVHALGALLVAALTAAPPPAADRDLPTDLPRALRRLLTALSDPEPRRRPTALQTAAALRRATSSAVHRPAWT